MVGLERSTLPLIGETTSGSTSSAAVLSFIVAFGLAKSFTNLAAGALAERLGRRRLLIAGWAVALPVPLLIAVAPSWGWIVAANVLLGINQGLAWSMTVVMKIDLVGPKRRGLALGLNEAAGYGGVAVAAALSGWLAAEFAARDVLVVAGAAIAVIALAGLASLFVRDTAAHVALEQAAPRTTATSRAPPLREAFPRRHLPRARAARLLAGRPGQQPQRRARLGPRPALPRRPRRLRRRRSASSPALYPARLGRRPDLDRPLVRPRRAQAADRRRHAPPGRRARAARRLRRRGRRSPPRPPSLLGVGTALVYPTLIAAISDAVSPVARAPTVGVYRFWRDMGYVAGGLIAGIAADALGYGGAIAIVAALTAASGLWVLADLPPPAPDTTPCPATRCPAKPWRPEAPAVWIHHVEAVGAALRYSRSTVFARRS